MKRLWVIALACCVAIIPGYGFADMTLKLGMVAPPTHPQYIANKAFADLVKEKTKGAITIDVFPMGQLGGERSMVEQVQGGTLEMTDVTTAVISNFVPEAVLFELPFIWPSRSVAYSVLADPEFWTIMSDAFPKRGMIAFGYGENEFRDLTNVKREIRKPEDVKGLKIRVIEAPVYIDTWQLLGASPVPMPFPEVYTGLQQGVIDAQENPLLTSILMKFTEVCPYATILNYSLTECIKLVNIDVWGKLTPEQQQIFKDGAQMAIQMNRELSIKATAEHLAKIEAEGKLKVVNLTPGERDAFSKAVMPIHEKYDKKLGTIPNKPEYGKFAGMSYLSMVNEKIKQYQQAGK